jgi:hypothetical protein
MSRSTKDLLRADLEHREGVRSTGRFLAIVLFLAIAAAAIWGGAP